MRNSPALVPVALKALEVLSTACTTSEISPGVTSVSCLRAVSSPTDACATAARRLALRMPAAI